MTRFLICTLLFYARISSAQIYYMEPEKLVDFDLKGPVKSVIFDSNCEPDYNNRELGSYSRYGCSYHLQFNRSGYLTLRVSKKEYSSGFDTILTTYINDTLPTYIYRGVPGYNEFYEFSYDEELNRTQIKSYQNSRLDQMADIKYTKNSERRQWKVYNSNGLKKAEQKYYGREKYNRAGYILEQNVSRKRHLFSLYSISYEYDEFQKLVRVNAHINTKRFDDYGVFSEYSYLEYSYDQYGNLIEEREYRDKEKNLRQLKVYRFDEKNQLIAVLDSNCVNGYFSSDSTWYNDAGQITETKFYSEGKLFRAISYRYDKSGFLISDLVRFADDESEYPNAPVSINGLKLGVWNKYENDSLGNWVKLTKTVFGEETFATREIEYYED